MAIPLIAVGGKILASLINQLITAVNGTALQGIVPTSVAGTGVTVSANGAVTFTNATNVSVNGVFSGTYDNYRIVWNSPSRTTSNTMNMRLRQAGVDVTGTSYAYNKGYDSGTARTVQQFTSVTAWGLDAAAGAGQSSDGYTDIFTPANGGYTTGVGLCFIWSSGPSNPNTITTGLYNNNSSPSDGFTMYPTGGTWSGTLRVYGYNNLT